MADELDSERVLELNHRRTVQNSRAKAAAFLARQQADEARAWYRFCMHHSGQSGLANGEFFSCEANDSILRGYISKEDDPTITEESLGKAYQDCREVLAPRPESTRPYERKTDTSVSRIAPQRFEPHPVKPAYAPFTRSEILSWDAARLHKEMAKGKDHVDSINKILAGQN